MKIITEHPENLGLEHNSTLKKVFNFFFIPILNNVSSKFQKFIKKSNKSAGDVIHNATTHKALEILYQRGKTKHKTSFLKKFFRVVWFNTNNARGVRNRLKITKQELLTEIIKIVKTGKPLSILSIASGSARAIVESLADANIPESYPVHVYFVDKNPEAITYSKDLIKNYPQFDQYNFSWFTGTISSFFLEYPEDKTLFDIVEIVGLMDYFEDEKLVEVFSKIYTVLNADGVVVSANITDNKERKFVTNVIEWPMIYRTAEEFASLLVRSGFDDSKMTVRYEPLKVHFVVTARK